MSKSKSFISIAAVAVVFAAGAAACGSSAKKAASSSSGAGGSSSPASSSPGSSPASSSPASSSPALSIPAGTVLNVGDQQQLLQTLFSSSGEGSALPYKVNFIEFGSGPLVDAGFAAKRIDLGFMGDLPAALAVSSGLPVKAVAAAEGVGAQEFLVAKPGFDSIAALKGKSVAYTTGTAEQAFALRALAQAGLHQSDVNQVNVTLQQLFTVLETGSVDASVITGVQEEKLYLQQHPDAKVLATNATVSPASYVYELATTAALADPAKRAAILDFVKRLIEASNWAYTHQQQYATDYLVDVEHETQAEANLGVTGGLISNFVPLGAAEQTALQNVVDLEYSAGAIKSSFRVDSLFDPIVSAAYNQVVAQVPQASTPAAGK